MNIEDLLVGQEFLNLDTMSKAVITEKTTNSVEVFNLKDFRCKDKEGNFKGIDCHQWYEIKKFLSKFKTLEEYIENIKSAVSPEEIYSWCEKLVNLPIETFGWISEGYPTFHLDGVNWFKLSHADGLKMLSSIYLQGEKAVVLWGGDIKLLTDPAEISKYKGFCRRNVDNLNLENV